MSTSKGSENLLPGLYAIILQFHSTIEQKKLNINDVLGKHN